jgi:competence CoiA-like predicted nuclease
MTGSEDQPLIEHDKAKRQTRRTIILRHQREQDDKFILEIVRAEIGRRMNAHQAKVVREHMAEDFATWFAELEQEEDKEPLFKRHKPNSN